MSKNTSNTAATAAAAKKVNKKTDAVAPVAATPAATESKAAAKKAVAKAAEVVAAPVTAVPVASEAAASSDSAAVETKTVDQEIAELIAVNQKLRDQAASTIKTLQKLQKRVAKDLKDAGRRRRRVKKEEDGAPKEKRQTIFTTPLPLKDELCAFLSKPKGTQMTPAEVTKAFSAYVKAHNLKDAQKGQVIHPDAAMRKAFGLKDGEEFSYRLLQKVLYASHYVLPKKA